MTTLKAQQNRLPISVEDARAQVMRLKKISAAQPGRKVNLWNEDGVALSRYEWVFVADLIVKGE